MSCWRSFGAAEFLDSCLRGLMVLLLAFGAGGCLFWTDVVGILPGSGLVGWCLESVFLLIRTQLQFIPHLLSIWNRPRGTAKSQDGQQKRTLAHVKRKVATALSMKVKPV